MNNLCLIANQLKTNISRTRPQKEEAPHEKGAHHVPRHDRSADRQGHHFAASAQGAHDHVQRLVRDQQHVAADVGAARLQVVPHQPPAAAATGGDANAGAGQGGDRACAGEKVQRLGPRDRTPSRRQRFGGQQRELRQLLQQRSS